MSGDLFSRYVTHNYRIAFSGAGGTGKTTLAKSLNKQLALPLLPGAVRSICQLLGFDRLDLDAQQRALMQGAALQYHKQNEYDNRFGGFITDRTMADFCAYYSALLHKQFSRPDLAEAYEKLAFFQPIQYDLVFYVPPFSSEAQEDGFRYSGNMFWIEEYVREYLPQLVKKYYPNAHFLTTHTLEERLEEVWSVIKQVTEKV
jgi:nicotinamide riboside kinase